MTEHRSRARIFLRVGFALWLIIVPILFEYPISWVAAPPESALAACTQAGIAAAIPGAAILFLPRPPFWQRLLAFILYVLIAAAILAFLLPVLLVIIACSFFHSCP